MSLVEDGRGIQVRPRVAGVDPSGSGDCSSNVNVAGACTVRLTGPLRFDARP